MRRLLAVVVLVTLFESTFFAALAPLLPHLKDELGFSKSAAGLLTAAYAIGVALVAIPGGLIGARIGPKKVALTGIFLISVSSVGFGFADNYWQLVLARGAQGLGAGLAWTSAFSWLVLAAPRERRGELIGYGIMGATIGSLVMFKTLDVSQMGNGAIAGLVAITAPCAFVDPWAAVVIGFVVGILVPALVVLVDKLKIDDPIGCIPVHGVSGVLGTLAVGLFATRDRLDALNLSGSEAGIFYGGGGHQLWVQVYGVAATIAFTFTASFILFALIKYTVGLRVSEEDEMAGLDISEHGMYGYPEQFIEVPGAFPESAGSDGSSLFAGSKTATSSQ